jgi:hypothetical protein
MPTTKLDQLKLKTGSSKNKYPNRHGDRKQDKRSFLLKEKRFFLDLLFHRGLPDCVFLLLIKTEAI